MAGWARFGRRILQNFGITGIKAQAGFSRRQSINQSVYPSIQADPGEVSWTCAQYDQTYVRARTYVRTYVRRCAGWRGEVVVSKKKITEKDI